MMGGAIRFLQTEEILKKAVEAGAFPCASLVVGCGDETLCSRVFGRLSPGGDLASEQTRFDLASLTKLAVTTMLTLRAVESGRLCLWDRLGTFIDAPEDKRDITIKQLLTHTSGYSRGLHLWELTADPSRSTELLLSAPLLFSPGTRVEYSCAAYILLGQLLEGLYGQRLPELARREVFWPLGMRSTGFLPAGENIVFTEKQPDGTMLRGVVHDENARFLGGAAGNAGLFSTAGDMALLMRMLAMGGRLPDGTRYLTKATLDAAMSNHTQGMAQGRGLGFYLPWYDDGFTGDLFPKETVASSGFTGTSLALDPESGLYVVLLTNRVCPSRDNASIYRVRRLVHNTVYAAFKGQ